MYVSNATVEICAQEVFNSAKEIHERDPLKRVPTLFLVGDPESPYFRSLRRAATIAGVNISFGLPRGFGGIAVFDNEEEQPEQVIRAKSYLYDADIDHVTKVPAVTEAIYRLLRHRYGASLNGRHVVILGRGYAVAGLPRLCSQLNATVTVCHSRTPDLRPYLQQADIIVSAMPQDVDIDLKINWANHFGGRYVIDIGNNITSAGSKDIVTNRIGQLTAAIVMRNCYARETR